MCMSHLRGSKLLYKPCLGHPERHSCCKQGDRKLTIIQSKQSPVILTTSRLLYFLISLVYYVESYGTGCVSAGGWGSAHGRPIIWGEALWPGVHTGSHLHLWGVTMETVTQEHR